MKVKSLILSAATAVILPVVGFAGLASATAVGQIEGGNIYRVSNVTKNIDFTDPVNADLCDTVQFKVRIHNPGPDTLTNVNVKATLNSGEATSHSSKVTVTAPNANPSTTTDTAGVNLSKAGSLTYVAGSTELLDAHDSKLSTLPDGILGSGVSIGSVGVSTEQKRFVQFKAKLSCPEQPPKTPAYSCDAFNITADVNRSVKVSTFSTTATNGAVFKNATIDWNDGTPTVTDTNIVGKTHQYAKDGTYTITATARFTVNGQEVTAGGPNCVKQVTFKGDTPPTVTPPPTTPVTPEAPGKLVNTGPGSVAAVFGAVTAAGAMAHRWMLGRRLNG